MFTTVSNPLGLSVNDAFGRLWFANAPRGADGIGTLSSVDPEGQPLANTPSHLAGGIMAGSLTDRPVHQVIPGSLASGAMATALLGTSPDGSKRAVFAVATADGAIAQAHAEQALDGLSHAGTLAAQLPEISLCFSVVFALTKKCRADDVLASCAMNSGLRIIAIYECETGLVVWFISPLITSDVQYAAFVAQPKDSSIGEGQCL